MYLYFLTGLVLTDCMSPRCGWWGTYIKMRHIYMFRLNLSHIQAFENPYLNHHYRLFSSQAFDHSNYLVIASIFCMVYLGLSFLYCVSFFSWLDSLRWTMAFLIIEVSRSHTTHHARYDSSGRVISPTQRPLPDNTTFTTDRHPWPPNLFEPAIPESKRLQTPALDRTATGIGSVVLMEV
jgi:hypothetical protein